MDLALRMAWTDMDLTERKRIEMTMSIGIASAVAAPTRLASALVDSADATLHRAKRAGRGRCAF